MEQNLFVDEKYIIETKQSIKNQVLYYNRFQYTTNAILHVCYMWIVSFPF